MMEKSDELFRKKLFLNGMLETYEKRFMFVNDLFSVQAANLTMDIDSNDRPMIKINVSKIFKVSKYWSLAGPSSKSTYVRERQFDVFRVRADS